MYIVIAILAFGFLIAIHELGHFIAARIFRVRIFEYAIGMGPVLVSHTSKKTGIQYSLRMFPIGGFCSMQGELAETEEELELISKREVLPTEDQTKLGGLASKPAWQRLIVHMGGALMNILAGFLCIVILVFLVNVGGTEVAQFVREDESVMAASESQGLMVGDVILKVGSHRTVISDELFYEILHQGGTDEPLLLTVQRGDETLELSIVFPTIEESGTSFGDVDFIVYAEEKTVGVVLKQTFHKCIYMVRLVLDSIGDMLTGRYSLESVSGPVGTTKVVAEAASSGLPTFLYLVSMVAVNLGVFNLLPLPALDGGHIFYTLFEMISRRKLPDKIVKYIDTTGLVLLLGLMAVITFKDILSLF